MLVPLAFGNGMGLLKISKDDTRNTDGSLLLTLVPTVAVVVG